MIKISNRLNLIGIVAGSSDTEISAIFLDVLRFEAIFKPFTVLLVVRISSNFVYEICYPILS
jgi:hypothetical protein